MSFREKMSEAAVGGLAGLAVVATYIVLYRASRDGADAGDWLAFAGVVVGVMLTAGLTIAIQKYHEWQKFVPQRKRALFFIANLRTSTEAFISGRSPEQADADLYGVFALIEQFSHTNWEIAHSLQVAINQWKEARQISSWPATVIDQHALRSALDAMEQPFK